MAIKALSTSRARTARLREGVRAPAAGSFRIACDIAPPLAALQPLDADDERERERQQDQRHGAGGALIVRLDLPVDVDRRGQRATRNVAGDDDNRAELAERPRKTEQR